MATLDGKPAKLHVALQLAIELSMPLQAVRCLSNATLRRVLNGWLSSHAAHAHKQELLRVAVGKLQHRQIAMVRGIVARAVMQPLQW